MPTNAMVNVACYANCPEVTLTLNGKIIGTKKSSEAIDGVLNWQVPFEPGTLKAVGRSNGQDVCEYVLQTAGAPAGLHFCRTRLNCAPTAKTFPMLNFGSWTKRACECPTLRRR